MKCEECLPIIEERLDGELDERAANQLAAHLATCATCAQLCREIEQERQIYTSYRRDVEISPAMWDSVRAKIAQEKTGDESGLLSRLREFFAGTITAPRLSPALAAALVVITVGVTVAVMRLTNSDKSDTHQASGIVAVPIDKDSPMATSGGGDISPSVSTSKAESDDVLRASGKSNAARAKSKRESSKAPPTPEQLVRDAEQKYEAAIALLERDVNKRRSHLDSQVLARFDATLTDIDRAIAATRQAVRENPGDPLALRYMLAAYAKKVDVLREMAGG